MDHLALVPETVVDYVKGIGHRLGDGDYTFDPVYPKGRQDICVIKHTAEDSQMGKGFDTIYVVWTNAKGIPCYREVLNTFVSQAYVNINSIKVAEGDDGLTAEIRIEGDHPTSKNPAKTKKEQRTIVLN